MTTAKQYNKIVIGFVVQRYVDGRCTNQEFIGGDEVSYEDPSRNPWVGGMAVVMGLPARGLGTVRLSRPTQSSRLHISSS